MGWADVSDADLVERLRAGDESAFTVLQRRHAPAVAAAVVARGGADDRDALVHDTFSHAWERLDQLREPARFRPWVLAIARNLTVAGHRQRARSRPVEPADLEQPSDAPTADELAQLAELLSAIRDATVLLPRREAVALTLAVDLGFGPADLATALGVTEGNAKVILHRARRRLREALVQSRAL